MTFYIVGTGNTAWFMAIRLVKAGHTCMGIYGRQIDRAEQLAKAANSPVLNSLSDIDDNADCCILAITDHAIKDVASNFSFKHTTLIHTAGSVNRTVLEPYAEHTGVLWPIYSIIKENLPLHRDVPVTIRGNTEQAEDILLQLATSITDIYYTISWEQRQWLHLCAVLCNNFTNHMMAVSEQICNKQQIPFSLLYPIVTQTAERIRQSSPKLLQTGPAKRNDKITIDRHLGLLDQTPEWKALYEAITTSIEKMYGNDKEE